MAEKNRSDHYTRGRLLEKQSRLKKHRSRRTDTPQHLQVSWSDFEARTMEGVFCGIVSHVHGKLVTLVANDCVWDAHLSEAIPSKLCSELVVGDRVFFRQTEGESTVTIEARLPRESTLVRLKGDRLGDEQVIAANVDVAVIVAAKDYPAFRPRFIDRYLVICENGHIKPLICINKSDMAGDINEALQWYRSADILVVETSVTDGSGIEELKKHITGKIAVFVGNSGVGKSSLANVLLKASLQTQTVNAKTGKGKHTTTTSHLYHWHTDSYIIDTPGIRALGIFHIDAQHLKEGFKEFSSFDAACQYSDCTHSHEPICGVRQAVDDNLLSRHRYESYIRMLEE